MCGDLEHRRGAPQPGGQEGFLRGGAEELRFEAGVGTVTPNISIGGVSYITIIPKFHGSRNQEWFHWVPHEVAVGHQ